MFSDEDFDVSYDFTNNIATGDTLTSCAITIYDSEGTEHSATMIANETTSHPEVTFTVQNPPAVDIYEIKIIGTTTDSRQYVGKITIEVIGGVTLNTKIADSSANSYVTLSEINSFIRKVRGHTNVWDTLSMTGKKYLLIEACRDIDKFNFIKEKYYDNQALEFPRDDHPKITGDVATPITLNSFSNTSFTSDTYGSYKSNTNFWQYGTVHMTNATLLGEIRNIETSDISTDTVVMTASFTSIPTTNYEFIAFEPLDKIIKDAQCYQALYLLDNESGDSLQNYKAAGAKRVQIGDVEVEFVGGKSTMTRGVSPKAKQLLSQWIERYRKVLRG